MTTLKISRLYKRTVFASHFYSQNRCSLSLFAHLFNTLKLSFQDFFLSERIMSKLIFICMCLCVIFGSSNAQNISSNGSETVNSTESTQTTISSEVSNGPSSPMPIASSPEMQKLFHVLNSTLLSIDSLIMETMQNASLKGSKDFERVGGILRNVQIFLTNQTNMLSQDSAHHIEKSLERIETFFRESHKNLQDHMAEMWNVSNSKISNNQFSIVPAENSSSSGRSHSNENLVANLMQISSQVGQEFQRKVSGAENIVTNSLNQIQSQIQNFLSSINSVFSSVTSGLPTSLFNITLPSLPQITSM